MQLRDSNGDEYNKMTIDGIGRAAGAKQVLYVQITYADVEHPTGSDQARGIMTARVRIVDSDTGETRLAGRLTHRIGRANPNRMDTHCLRSGQNPHKNGRSVG